MQIFKYGIQLKNLEVSELEMVRNWRNSDDVRSYMQYQKLISSEMQFKWFKSLDSACNLYFVIQSEEEKIGLINLKEIDWELKTAEAGIFVGNRNFINSSIPVLATITIMEFAFEVLGLKTLKAKIGCANTKVIQFNESIGYKKNEVQTDKKFHYYQVNAKQFYTTTLSMRQTLEKLNTGGFQISMSETEKKALKIKEKQMPN